VKGETRGRDVKWLDGGGGRTYRTRRAVTDRLAEPKRPPIPRVLGKIGPLKISKGKRERKGRAKRGGKGKDVSGGGLSDHYCGEVEGTPTKQVPGIRESAKRPETGCSSWRLKQGTQGRLFRSKRKLPITR